MYMYALFTATSILAVILTIILTFDECTGGKTTQYNTLQHSAHNTLLTDIYRLFNKFLKLVLTLAGIKHYLPFMMLSQLCLEYNEYV